VHRFQWSFLRGPAVSGYDTGQQRLITGDVQTVMKSSVSPVLAKLHGWHNLWKVDGQLTAWSWNVTVHSVTPSNHRNFTSTQTRTCMVVAVPINRAARPLDVYGESWRMHCGHGDIGFRKLRVRPRWSSLRARLFDTAMHAHAPSSVYEICLEDAYDQIIL